jgi:hypothetical protein
MRRPAPPWTNVFGSGILVLTLSGGEIAAITRCDNNVLPFFGLPRTRPV